MHLFLLYDVIRWLGLGYLSPWNFLWTSCSWRILRIKRYVVGSAVWWVRPVWVQRSAAGVCLGLNRWSWALTRPTSMTKVWRYWPPGRRYLTWWNPRWLMRWCLSRRKLLLILRSILRDFLVWLDALLWLLVHLGGIKGFAQWWIRAVRPQLVSTNSSSLLIWCSVSAHLIFWFHIFANLKEFFLWASLNVHRWICSFWRDVWWPLFRQRLIHVATIRWLWVCSFNAIPSAIWLNWLCFFLLK